MKLFTIPVHFILCTVLIGLCFGAGNSGAKPMILGPLIGLTIGLSIYAITRLIQYLD